MNQHTEWTSAEEATAAEMWTRGCSASEIARVLGRRSRSAVIGRMHRMGVTQETRMAVSEPSRGLSAPAVRISGPNPRGAHRTAPKPGPQNKPGAVFGKLGIDEAASTASDETRAARAAEGRKAIARAAAPDVPSPNALPFLEARRGCKWPIGEGRTMLSCCNPIVRGVYCEGHAPIAFSAYQPSIREGRPVQMKKFAAAMAKRDGVEPAARHIPANDGLWDTIQDAA